MENSHFQNCCCISKSTYNTLFQSSWQIVLTSSLTFDSRSNGFWDMKQKPSPDNYYTPSMNRLPVWFIPSSTYLNPLSGRTTVSLLQRQWSSRFSRQHPYQFHWLLQARGGQTQGTRECHLADMGLIPKFLNLIRQWGMTAGEVLILFAGFFFLHPLSIWSASSLVSAAPPVQVSTGLRALFQDAGLV